MTPQKKRAVLAFFVLATAGATLAAEKKPGSGQTSPAPAPSAAVAKLEADLAVTEIGFTSVQLNPNAAPRKCYGYLFTFTIRNVGKLTSGNFRYRVETTGGPAGAYGNWSVGGPVSLKPGENLTYGPTLSDQQNWCVDNSWKSKVKVTADIDNSVHEPNKANNVLEKVFTPLQYQPAAFER